MDGSGREDGRTQLSHSAEPGPLRLTAAEKRAELERQLGVTLDEAGRIAWKPAILLTRNNEAAAKDLVQDSFVRLVAALESGKLNIDTNPIAYLRKVVKNTFLSNQRRSENRTAREVLVDDLEMFDIWLRSSEDRQPEVVAQLTALNEAFMRAIRSLRLPDETRRIATLLANGGHSVAEIAEMLDLPISTVRSRIKAIQRDARNFCNRNGWRVS